MTRLILPPRRADWCLISLHPLAEFEREIIRERTKCGIRLLLEPGGGKEVGNLDYGQKMLKEKRDIAESLLQGKDAC